MSDDAKDFDPRFDPAFQRGYDGPTTVAPARSPLVPQQRESLISKPPVARTEIPAAPVAQQVSPTTPVSSQQGHILVEPSDEVIDEPETRRFNPFLVALLAVAVLLVGGGLYLTSRLGEFYANTQSSASYDYITLQVMTIAAPMLIVLGIATGVGVLFIYAVRWGR